MTIKMPWKSNITSVEENELITHGLNQRDIIRDFCFEEMVLFLLRGTQPDENEIEMFRSVLVAYISHGITGQSTLSVMEAADCRTDFLSAMLSGFLVGSGKYHQGALFETMKEIQHYKGMEALEVKENIFTRIKAGEKIIGFGHRFHRFDPRAETLMQLVEERNFAGKNIETVKIIDSALQDLKGLRMNLGAAAGSILLDLGIDPIIAHLIIVLGRSPMYAAAYLERLSKSRPHFQKIEIHDLLEDDEILPR